MRVDSEPGTDNEVERSDVNKEEEHGMEVDVDSFGENGDGAGNDPAEGENETVVFEEVVPFVQTC